MVPNSRVEDHVSLHLDDKLTHLSHRHCECNIYRVYDRLRRQNEKAYEPEILAIGPYHHHKANRVMEDHKLWNLQQLLKRRNETSVDRYIVAMRDLQERARRCYADSVSLNKDEFVVMMLLDSCFIIELFRKFTIRSMQDGHDPLFKMEWIHHIIWRDLLLFENQLPFFILVQLFEMTKIPDPRDNIIDLAMRYYYCTREYYYYSILPSPEKILKPSSLVLPHDVKHVLDLAHHVTSHSFAKLLAQRNLGKKEKRSEFIHCATELHEAGIRFKKANHRTPLLNIKFVNGTLEIPQFTVEEKTECLFRNIIAHEQHLQDSNPKYVTDYLTFMFCLINSSKDVSLLRRNGIINNMLGDDEAICAMFTKASTCVFVSRDGFCYSEVFNDINEHCGRRWNIWTAKLRHNYFNSPWTIISFLGAVVLLLLTSTQTVFTMFPFFHKSFLS
ncbi:putative UPF0481 protein At3g02645 isoform X2 [Camellia sinensis]|nr:putative UPF0481 protein At3g02645 isoform X1 [Camellia sinensis]XP_028108757.1 putative UPF0481 protein At3g02645 isoform X2 [Camellia sinensis]